MSSPACPAGNVPVCLEHVECLLPHVLQITKGTGHGHPLGRRQVTHPCNTHNGPPTGLHIGKTINVSMSVRKVMTGSFGLLTVFFLCFKIILAVLCSVCLHKNETRQPWVNHRRPIYFCCSDKHNHFSYFLIL